MRSQRRVPVMAIVAFLFCPGGVCAWDVQYDAGTGLLPTAASPTWRGGITGTDTVAIVGDALRLEHSAGSVYYGREQWEIGGGVPVTLEARMCVDSSSHGVAVIAIETRGAYASLSVLPDRIGAYDWENGNIEYMGDFTAYHTFRVAYDGGTRVYAWVDRSLALSWGLSGAAGQGGVSFGTPAYSAPSISHWQYVAYSKEFLPIPEPSSLLAVLAGAVGCVGWRRRK